MIWAVLHNFCCSKPILKTCSIISQQCIDKAHLHLAFEKQNYGNFYYFIIIPTFSICMEARFPTGIKFLKQSSENSRLIAYDYHALSLNSYCPGGSLRDWSTGGGWKTIVISLVGAWSKGNKLIKRFMACMAWRGGLSRKNRELFLLKLTDTTVDSMTMLTKCNFNFRENSEANITQDKTLLFLWENIGSDWCGMALLYYVWAIRVWLIFL